MSLYECYYKISFNALLCQIILNCALVDIYYIIYKYFILYNLYNIIYLYKVVDQNRFQKYMTNSLFNIEARAFVVETPASRYRRVILDKLRL